MNKRRRAEPARVLRWVFQRGGRVVTCVLEQSRGRRRGYAVRLVPSWGAGKAAVESFASATGAFQRHAALAMELRSSGWRLNRAAGGSSES